MFNLLPQQADWFGQACNQTRKLILEWLHRALQLRFLAIFTNWTTAVTAMQGYSVRACNRHAPLFINTNSCSAQFIIMTQLFHDYITIMTTKIIIVKKHWQRHSCMTYLHREGQHGHSSEQQICSQVALPHDAYQSYPKYHLQNADVHGHGPNYK